MESAEERPLPAGWVRYVDGESGEPYYHNAELKQTTWDHPGRWKVGLFFDSLREKKPTKISDEWVAEDGEDDFALRRRLSERIEVLKSQESRGDGQISTLRDELGRRRKRLERLREALDLERRKAAELVVAAGGEGPAKQTSARHSESSSSSSRREEELRCLRLQVADLQRQVDSAAAQRQQQDDDDDDDDLDETMGDIDAAIEDVAVLEAAGVSSRMASLLRTRPWDDELIKYAVCEDVAIEWQARQRGTDDEGTDDDDDDSIVAGVVGVAENDDHDNDEKASSKDDGLRHSSWISPLEVVLLEEGEDGDSIPVALRRPKRFPKTKKFLSRNRRGARTSSLFTDSRATSTYESLEKASKLPGTSWQWLSGWRIEGGPDGWIYGDVRSLAKLASAVDEAFVVGTSSRTANGSNSFAEDDDDDSSQLKQKTSSPVRCRRWRRTRALVTPPADPKKNPDSSVCVVARKLLELRAHSASLDVLASKLSDQLVATRAALDTSERKAARLPALEAALVETSSNLRDTELRRDALQRQLMATAGMHSSSSRQVVKDVLHASEDAEEENEGSPSSAQSDLPFHISVNKKTVQTKNNPFVDDEKQPATLDNGEDYEDTYTSAVETVSDDPEEGKRNNSNAVCDEHAPQQENNADLVVDDATGDDEDTVDL